MFGTGGGASYDSGGGAIDATKTTSPPFYSASNMRESSSQG